MSEAFTDTELTPEEQAYMESGGNPPASTPEEPKSAKPEDKPAEAEAAPESEASDDDGEEAAEQEASDGSSSKQRRIKFETYDRVKKEGLEYRRQLEEAQRNLAVLQARAEERINALQRQFQPQQQPAQQPQPQQDPLGPPPNMNEDPMGYMAWQDKRAAMLEERLGKVDQTFQSVAQQAQAQAELAQLEAFYKADNQEALKQQPQYADAYNFLINQRRRELAVQFPHATPAQREQQLVQEERQFAYLARQNGQRPAEIIWQTAHMRGFNAQPAQPPQPAVPQVDPAAEQARLEAQARGQEKNRSLSNMGRPATGGGIPSVDTLLDMTTDQFTEFMSKNPGYLAKQHGIAN